MQDHEHQQVSADNDGAAGWSPTQVRSPRPAVEQGFADVAQKHLAAVVGQILLAEGAQDVSLWQPIITRLALDAAQAVLPSALAAFGVSDPRFYIKVFTGSAQLSQPECAYNPALSVNPLLVYHVLRLVTMFISYFHMLS